MTRPNDIDDETWNDAYSYVKEMVDFDPDITAERYHGIRNLFAKAIKAARERALEEAAAVARDILVYADTTSASDQIVYDRIRSLIHPQS